MMIVNLEMKNDILAALLARSRDAGLSVEDVIDELLREALEQPQVESVNISEILAESLARVQNMPPDTEFTLEDVVSKDSWEAMSGGDRKSFGKLFRKQTESSELAEWKRRSSGNKAIYRAL